MGATSSMAMLAAAAANYNVISYHHCDDLVNDIFSGVQFNYREGELKSLPSKMGRSIKEQSKFSNFPPRV